MCHVLTITRLMQEKLCNCRTKTPSAIGQVWHLPTVNLPLTGKQFIATAAKYMNASDKVKVLPRWILKLAGWFNPFMKEMYEMHYQDEFPFVFNSSKFEKAFDFKPASWEEGIKQTAEWYLEAACEIKGKHRVAELAIPHATVA